LQSGLRLGFWLLLALALARALWPDPYTEPVVGQMDKLVHAAAFYGLTLTAAAAHPRAPLIGVAAAMLGFGALVEILQAIPMLHRDASWLDLAADMVGILVALAPTLLPGLRQALRR
jgi:VanZ family protein